MGPVDDAEKVGQEWLNYSSTVSSDGFYNVLPMIDVSAQNSGEAFYTAIGLAILVAQRSHNRILAYGEKSEWIVLTQPDNFMQCIEDLRSSISSIEKMGSDLHGAMRWFHQQYLAANQNMSDFTVRKQFSEYI
jgi:hypothetical protein